MNPVWKKVQLERIRNDSAIHRKSHMMTLMQNMVDENLPEEDLRSYVQFMHQAAHASYTDLLKDNYDAILLSLKVIKKAIKTVMEKKEVFSDDEVYNLFDTQGCIQLLLGEFHEARSSFTTALKSVEQDERYKCGGDLFPLEVNVIIGLCNSSLCSGNINQCVDASDILRKTLASLEMDEVVNLHWRLLFNLYGTLALTYEVRGNLLPAIKSLRTQYSILKKWEESNPSLKVIEDLIQYFICCHMEGMYKSPLWIFQRLELIQSKLSPHRGKHMKENAMGNHYSQTMSYLTENDADGINITQWYVDNLD